MAAWSLTWAKFVWTFTSRAAADIRSAASSTTCAGWRSRVDSPSAASWAVGFSAASDWRLGGGPRAGGWWWPGTIAVAVADRHAYSLTTGDESGSGSAAGMEIS
jgi:hypothetical protein